jgi:hypothetical protein
MRSPAPPEHVTTAASVERWEPSTRDPGRHVEPEWGVLELERRRGVIGGVRSPALRVVLDDLTDPPVRLQRVGALLGCGAGQM